MGFMLYLLCAVGAVVLLFTIRHIDNLHEKRTAYFGYVDYDTKNYKWCRVPIPFLILCVCAFMLGPVSVFFLAGANLIYLLVYNGRAIARFFSGHVDLCEMINIRVSINSKEGNEND